MQMQLQTRRAEVYVVTINGADAAKYDFRSVEDLLDPWIDLLTVSRALTTREASTIAVERLLELGVDLFFKIDSDDLYMRNYLAYYEEEIQARRLCDQPVGFCANLIDQYWLNARPGGSATVQRVRFAKGLGLSKLEESRGMRVGAPPTFAFDRRVAELLAAQGRRPPYEHISSDDQAWRTILIDNGLLIDQISTTRPVFGYLRHDNNTSQLVRKSQ